MIKAILPAVIMLSVIFILSSGMTIQFKPLHECFEEIEEVTPKHLLFEDFANYLQKPLPKVIFYIIMDELYSHLIDKDEKTKDLGYRLKLIAK